MKLQHFCADFSLKNLLSEASGDKFPDYRAKFIIPPRLHVRLTSG